ncbi:hypothetical protein [Streptomyces sp. NPDC001970]
MTDSASVSGFRPTHVVPGDGMQTWESPDASRPSAPLDAYLPVQVVDRRGDWGRVLCANGWSAWVDGRLLVPVAQDPPSAGRPLDRAVDPRPLLARAEEALSQYRRAAESLAGGGSDGETFRRSTQGVRVGVVVDGESVWLYDGEQERWMYCDGTRLSTFASDSPPRGTPKPSDTAADGLPTPAPPTRSVPLDGSDPQASPPPPQSSSPTQDTAGRRGGG